MEPALSARPLRLLVLAGEPSGDRHAARVVRALRALGPIEARGLAGPEMRAAGVEAVVPMEEISVLGITEVLRHWRPILRARTRLLRDLARRPDLVLPVDFPGFNLRFAGYARRTGIPVLYYVSPQIWAWGRDRLPGIREVVDHMAVVFRFEVETYEEAGIPVTFVGHPLVEELCVDLGADEVRARAGLAPGAPYVALLPGSRPQEVRRLATPMLDAFRALRRERPQLGAVIAAASPRIETELRRAVRTLPEGAGLVTGHTHAVVAHARGALVTSGTATLETALLGTPLVAAYRLSPASWWLARRWVRLSRIALPNIVAGEEVAPERLQEQANGPELAAALAPLLDDGERRTRALAGLARVREAIGGPGAAARVAALAMQLAREAHPNAVHEVARA